MNQMNVIRLVILSVVLIFGEIFIQNGSCVPTINKNNLEGQIKLLLNKVTDKCKFLYEESKNMGSFINDNINSINFSDNQDHGSLDRKMAKLNMCTLLIGAIIPKMQLLDNALGYIEEVKINMINNKLDDDALKRIIDHVLLKSIIELYDEVILIKLQNIVSIFSQQISKK